MANKTRVLGQTIRKGIKMTEGSRWRLVAQAGRKRAFAGTLLTTFNLGHRRVAFSACPRIETAWSPRRALFNDLPGRHRELKEFSKQ